MSNSDERVSAANRLGAEIPYDHPVPPRRDRFGAAWCPICYYGLPDPTYFENGFRNDTGVVVKGMTVFIPACPNCKQELTWTGWSRLLSDSELMTHINAGCTAPRCCTRCRGQLNK